MQSDIGSVYGAANDDALSQFMGQSEFGGANDIASQSLIGG